MSLLLVFACLCLVECTVSSSLISPPQSSIVVAFEDIYDTSLLAATLSDQGIDATLIIPSSTVDELYESLIDVEILTFNVDFDESASAEIKAIRACENLLEDQEILKKIGEIQPTFTIFPAFRHDACLIPWAKFIESIPVIWTRNPDEEVYVFEYTGAALPVQNAGFWTRLSTNLARRSIFSAAKDDYAAYALRVAGKYLPDAEHSLDNLYSNIHLILWGADTVLRSDFAPLTQFVVEVGCHHCRGPHPLQKELQKSLVEHRMGTIVSLLDENYESLLRELATKLPQGREGQAVVWKIKNWQNKDDTLPENLFITAKIDRQDLIGYGRTRVLLSHCADTELLETAFHGTPVICFPRNTYESRNAARAVHLGFARSTADLRDTSSEEIVNAITQIHEVPEYRENARKVSVAIRDRINPAADRLIYWLRYMARMKNGNVEFLSPISSARTSKEDVQFFLGLFVGSIVGVIATIACVLVYVLVFLSNRAQRSKGRYTR